MAWVAGDSLDSYNGTGTNTGMQSRWTGGFANTSMQTGRFGGQCVQIVPGSASGFVQRSFAAARTAGVNGFAMRWPTMPSTTTYTYAHFCIMQGNTYQFSVRVNPNAALEVWRLTGVFSGTLLGTSPNNVVLPNTWQYLEIIWTASTTAGAVQCLIDNTSVLTLTGLNNCNAGSASCDGFRLSSDYSTSGTVQLDDYNEGDAAVTMGPLRNETLRPNADSAITWTPNSGANNYSRVNEALCDGDTTYVQTVTPGNKDLYTYPALSATPSAILGVMANSFAYKTDAGAHTMNNSVTSGSTVSDGATFTLAGSYSKFERPMATDPNTGAAWTQTGLAALLAGPKLVT